MTRLLTSTRTSRPKARIKFVHPYVVIYDHDADADTAIVLRVLHGRRDITAKLISR